MRGLKLLEAFIVEQIESGLSWEGDEDPRPTPTEKEFVNGSDELVGYIFVQDRFEHIPVAHAPIYKTDGPDRPFLVRTTDTKWHIPFWIVRHIYPDVEKAFNFVDSERNWEGMGPGDRGKKGEFEWEWVTDEPQIQSSSEIEK